MRLFGFIAIAVIIVGAVLWLKPRKGVSKPSGVGDIGQYKK